MEELKKLRESLNLTLTEFAREINVSKSLYEKVERGEREPSRNFITKLKKKHPKFDVNIFFTQK